MGRKIVDCRDMPSDRGCTITISGDEDEVVRVAALHAIADHGHDDNDKLREMIRSGLKDENVNA